MSIDEKKLENFLNKALSDLGGTISSSMVVVGEKLGFYKALSGAGPLTSEELSKKTGILERYVREWLNNQAAGGYLTYDPLTQKFTLPDEQALCLADENSPHFLLGAFQIFTSLAKDESKIIAAFKDGKGISWGDHDCGLYEGTERFFRTGYSANLVNTWIPSLVGVSDKLKTGAKIADVGCGHGASTIIMAQAFPESEFIGFDYHQASIDVARKRAKDAGLTDNIKFELAESTNFPGKNYDLVTVFDALHDMGNPLGTASHTFKSLKSNGTWMVVEPFASDKIEENHNPIGRIFYGASSFACVPCSLDMDGPALGAQAGPKKLEHLIKGGGFTKFRIAATNPFNMVIEANP